MKIICQHQWPPIITSAYHQARNVVLVTDSGAHDRYMKTAMIGQCTSSHGARLPQRSLLKQHDAKTQRSLSWR